jgi:hypothetical protein
MRPTGANARTAFVWRPSARKQGAVVAGLLCPSYLPTDNLGGILVQGVEARLESALFGGRRDNQN